MQEGSECRLWHFASFAVPQKIVAYWSNNGQAAQRSTARSRLIGRELNERPRWERKTIETLFAP
jgi:hypothetical protein